MTDAASNSSSVFQDSLFKIVSENNKTLETARREMEASSLEAKTGNAPTDPEVEFGYLSGFPSSIGNRVDFRVTQEFDFPSAYFQKAKVKNIKTAKSELIYKLTRQEVLSQAMHIYIERVYLNCLEILLSKRLEKAEMLNTHYKQLVASGEEDLLSLSQSNLQTVALRVEMEQLRGNIAINKESLLLQSGGLISTINDTLFPTTGFTDKESLIQAYEKSPALDYYYSQVDLKTVSRQLALSQSLPKFKAGYYSETVIDQRFRGISMGLSIPLWENANKVKYAKAEIIHAGADLERYKSSQRMELEKKLAKRQSLKGQISELRGALLQINDEDLLSMALDMGEISLSEYIYTSELYFQNLIRLLEYERDLYLLESDLMKVYY
jgi:outer membrane protein TolC